MIISSCKILFDWSFKIFGPFPCELCLNTAISNPFCPKFTYFASILLIAFADLFFQFFAGKIGAPLHPAPTFVHVITTNAKKCSIESIVSGVGRYKTKLGWINRMSHDEIAKCRHINLCFYYFRAV